MRRIDVVHRISDNVLMNFLPDVSLVMRNLIADCVVSEMEKLALTFILDPNKNYVASGSLDLNRDAEPLAKAKYVGHMTQLGSDSITYIFETPGENNE